jgi:hypothetical protein
VHRTLLVAVLLLAVPNAAEAAPPPTCSRLYSQAEFATYARAVFNHRDTTSKAAHHRLDRMRRCQHSLEARRNALRLMRRLREARDERVNRRQHYLGLQAKLEAIAWCESKGNPRAIGGGGAYRGKYQFSFGTWASVGGNGDPAAASEREQDYRAALLLRRDGAGHWPVCG